MVISELNPANIERFESEEKRIRWQEAEQFNAHGKYGRWHIIPYQVIDKYIVFLYCV